MGSQRVSQSRGQLVSHNKRPSGVSTSTQWVEARYHSGGSSFCARDRMVRPGSSTSHVRSQLMAPQSRILTVVPDAVILCFPSSCGQYPHDQPTPGCLLLLWFDGPHFIERDGVIEGRCLYN